MLSNLRSVVRRELSLGLPRSSGYTSKRCGLSVVSVLLGLLASASLTAQAPYRQELLPGLSSFDVGSSSIPSLADLDADGDQDAVVGQYDGLLVLFANTGTALIPSFEVVTGDANPFEGIDTGDNAHPDLVDLDSDGDLDAVVGTYNGGIRYFENVGSASVAAFEARTGTANPLNGVLVGYLLAPDLADLDGDGDFDVPIGRFSGLIEYIENTGSSSHPSFVLRTGTASPLSGIDVGEFSSPELADLDNDGDLDLTVGERQGTFRYFQNTGSADSPAFVTVSGAASPFGDLDLGFGSAPELADLDGDGDLDFLPGDDGGSLRLFVNMGSATEPQLTELSGTGNPVTGLDAGWDSVPDLADLDGDLDLDLLIGNRDGIYRYLVNTGTSTEPSYIEATGPENPFAAFDMGTESTSSLSDLDGDGDLDAILGARFGSLRYFENSGSPAVASFFEVTGSANPVSGIGGVGGASRPSLADLDSDGDIDLVLGQYIGSIRFLENTGAASLPAFKERTGSSNPFSGIDIGSFSTPDLVDLDLDGDLDAVVGRFFGALHFLENIGTTTAPSFVQRTGSANPFAGIALGLRSSPSIADLDGDGDADVLTGEDGGHLVYFRSDSALFLDGFETGDTSAWSLTVP